MARVIGNEGRKFYETKKHDGAMLIGGREFEGRSEVGA